MLRPGAPSPAEANNATRTPDLSVVVNTRNRADWLEGALQSLITERASASEDAAPYEIEILVIDQSTDERSRAIAHKLPIRYVRHEGTGLSTSRNVGIALARGPWVAFIDDDARVRPGWARTLLAATQEPLDPRSPVAIAGRVVDLEDGSLHFSNGAICTDGRHVSVRPLSAPLPGDDWVPTGMGTNVAFHQETLMRLGGFDPFYRYFHDESDVFLRIAKAGYATRYVDDLIVDHAFAPADWRSSLLDIDYAAIVRSQLYFAWIHRPGKAADSMRRVFGTLFGKKRPLRVVARRTRRRKLPLGTGVRHVRRILIQVVATMTQIAFRNFDDYEADRFNLDDATEIGGSHFP